MKNKSEQLFDIICKTHQIHISKTEHEYVFCLQDIKSGLKSNVSLPPSQYGYLSTRLLEVGQEMILFMKNNPLEENPDESQRMSP